MKLRLQPALLRHPVSCQIPCERALCPGSADRAELMPGRPDCCARSNTTLPGVTPSRASGASRSASDQPSSASTWSASRPSRNPLTTRLDLLLSGNAPRVGSQWTDSGSAHDERHLKHRARKITRPVPIPPEMVDQIRTHINRFGVSADGRLFRGARMTCGIGGDAGTQRWRTGTRSRAPRRAWLSSAAPRLRRMHRRSRTALEYPDR